MNIGITVYPTYGGSGIVGSELGRELAQRGHNVHFISSTAADAPDGTQRARAFSRSRDDELTRFSSISRMIWRWRRKWRPSRGRKNSICCTFITRFRIPSARFWRANQSSKSVTFPSSRRLHGTDITLVGADRTYLPITRYGLQQSDGVTAVSRFLKQATIETFDFDEIEVIPNFICGCHYKHLDRIASARRACAERRKTAGSRFQFPRRQASGRLRRDSGESQSAKAEKRD